MEHHITTFIVSIVAAFFLRTIAIMASYSLTYGQVFGMIKISIAQKINHMAVVRAFKDVNSQSDGEEAARMLYDRLCDYKDIASQPRYIRRWSFLLSLLDCSYCIGFWVSLICAVMLAFKYGILCLVVIPVMTFFFIEKL